MSESNGEQRSGPRGRARAVQHRGGDADPAGAADAPARCATPSPADVAATGGLAAALAAKPPVDDERVAQIKKAIANGTFPILPATIADRLLARALRLDEQ